MIKTPRKTHECACCQRPIAVGQRHFAEVGVIEGEFEAHRICMPCDGLIARLKKAGELCQHEPFFFCDVPDLARDAGEPWPPQAAEGE